MPPPKMRPPAPDERKGHLTHKTFAYVTDQKYATSLTYRFEIYMDKYMERKITTVLYMEIKVNYAECEGVYKEDLNQELRNLPKVCY
ncbi:hypothetical protein NDU88_005094 [Pleurodeles waltl]|uniref:Uncharacterized protein n=1 Tax=Pleurodeles waltl TaxID=8319 RepID=A0AAV7TAC8_PLEWA|nr:hypothetical protein NDU88_005094 [Pleurodeles waltl]